ncbi:MAG TPA: hypothetical protein VGI74_27620 [Streptosporangiaceae bacterium]
MINWQGRDGGLVPGPNEGTGARDGDDRPAVHVLADRVASALVHHEPGWRLPRRSALARRYGVSPAEMEAAIEELAARNLLRRLPDGQVYRASPADYLIRLEGLNDLRASIDPMGAMIECASRHVSLRRVPEDIGGALGLSPGDPVSVVRCLWTSAGGPAAFSATYLPEHLSFLSAEPSEFADALKPPQVMPTGAGYPHPAQPRAAAHPAGLYVELQPPAPSVARSLRLAAGQPAVNVTVRFDAVPAGGPIALATAVLRSDMFRVVVESPQAPRVNGLSDEDDVLWTHTAEGWEP